MAKAGRPTIYSDDMLARAKAYVDGAYQDVGDVVPTIVGLALYIGVATDTVYDWASQPEKSAFSDTLTRARQVQHQGLVNGGLSGTHNPAISKLMMANHGYSEKTQQDVTSSDGSMTPRSNIDYSQLSDETLRDLERATKSD